MFLSNEWFSESPEVKINQITKQMERDINTILDW